MGAADEHQRIRIQIVGEHGLVWSVPDILKLRTEHRLVGCLVGGIAGFKSQVSVGGLPLKLSPEEVSLALQAGWVQLYQTCFCITTSTKVGAQQHGQQKQQQPAAAALPASPQQQETETDIALRDVEPYDEYYAAYYGLPPPTQEQLQQQQQQQQQQEQQLEEQQQQQQQQQPQQQCQGPVPPWYAAVTSGACFELPMTVQQAAAAAVATPMSAGDTDSIQNSSSSSSSAADILPFTSLQPAQWSFPHTQQQQLRVAVFADLHSRGYFLTSGSKFGGDFLAYPGDPNLYHAQFVVRVLPLEQVLNPVLFKGLARGVHAARKHLLLASVVHSSSNSMSDDSSEEPWHHNQEPQQQDEQQQRQQQQCQIPTAAGSDDDARPAKVVYITVAKEDGFGASK